MSYNEAVVEEGALVLVGELRRYIVLEDSSLVLAEGTCTNERWGEERLGGLAFGSVAMVGAAVDLVMPAREPCSRAASG